LRDLDAAYRNFFHRVELKKKGKWKGKTGYPKFKSKKKGLGSFRLTGSIHVFENAVQLPRLGRLRLKEAGYLPTDAKILCATVTEHAGKWFVSLRHSRRKKGSRNREKARRRLARIHARIANIRNDTLHKATSSIVARTKPDTMRPRVVVIEDLNISNMLKNRRLSRAIADVGLYEFRQQLEYKARQAGVSIKVADRWYPSSKTCSACGYVKDELPLDERVFVCEVCGNIADRDYNAARNLAALA
jgi:putative transposase